MTRSRSVSFPFTASIGLLLSLLLAGCSGDTSTSTQFVQSATAPAPGLVKLVPKSVAGSRILLDVLIFGPEPDLDLSAFEFGIDIGNTGLVRFVPQATYIQSALVADAGQTIEIDVDGSSDPSLVSVVVEKRGGGPGNGFASDAAIVIELAFDVQGSGETTLSFVGLGANPPRALDSARAPIGAVTFDDEKSGVSVVTRDGGY